MDRLTPQETERLLAGHSASEPKLAALADSLRAMRETYTAPVRAEVKAQHVQAMMEAFGQTSTAPSPASSFRPRRRARLIKRASVAVAASVLLGGSAMAATGSLPAPAQDALAKAAHGLGIDLPHTKSHPTPRASSLPGPQFAAAKKAWLACVKEKGKDACGTKPMAQDFVTHSPKPSHEPASTEPSEHGVGNPHHSPTAPRATSNPGHGGENPGNGSDDQPVKTPNAHSGDSGHGADDLKTPQPVKTPHV